MLKDISQILPFAVFFIVVPVLVFFIISKMSGWSRLAEVYRFNGDFEGTKFNFISGRIGIMNYNSILFLRASSRGFYISVPLPFKFFSPPLLIPWDDVNIEGVTGLLKNQVLFRFRKRNDVKFKLYKKAAFAIIREAEKNGFTLKDLHYQPFSISK